MRKNKNDSISSLNRIWILIGAAAGALIFSRLIGAVENPVRFFSGNEGLMYYYSNKTIIGGVLGGLLGVEVSKKFIGEKQSSGDLFTYPLILAIIIGRIGCFSMGVYEPTYGNPTTSNLGMDLGDGIHRHPTALYEIVALLVIWLFIYQVNRKYLLKNGTLFKVFMMLYLSYRFAVEFIRPGYEIIIGLNVIQLTCLLGLIYYKDYFISPKKLLLDEKRK